MLPSLPLKSLIVTGMLLFAAPVAAQESLRTILDLPPGHTLLNISATERVSADQDLLVAQLRYEAENTDPRALQNEINSAMQRAVEAARAADGVRVSTQQYYVHLVERYPRPEPVRNGERPPQPERTWRGNQGLELKSGSADTLLALTGQLQEMGLIVSSLNYMLSPEKTEEIRDDMMEAALQKIMAKAHRAAAALGKDNAEMLEISVDTGHGQPPMPMMRTMAMDSRAESMAAPVAEAGQTDLSLSVSAQVLLKP